MYSNIRGEKNKYCKIIKNNEKGEHIVSNTSLKVWLASIVSLALVIVIGAVIILPRNNNDNSMETLTLDYAGDENNLGVIENNPNLDGEITGGSITATDNATESTSIMTAVADQGYEFGYWVNASNVKISGDESIKVVLSAKANFTPVFIEDSNVINITSLDTIRSDISSVSTNGKIYKMMNDVYLSAFTAMGEFQGILDGNGKKIYGISINSSNNAGLFSSLNGAVIKNLIISSGSITTSATYAGSFASTITNALLSRCVSYIALYNTNGAGIVGGIVGASISTTVKSMLYCCGFYGSVSGPNANSILGSNSIITADSSNSCDLFRNFNSGAIYQS